MVVQFCPSFTSTAPPSSNKILGSGCDCGKEVARTVPSCSGGGPHGRAERKTLSGLAGHSILFREKNRLQSVWCFSTLRFSHLNQTRYITFCVLFPHLAADVSHFDKIIRPCTVHKHFWIFAPIAYLSMRTCNWERFHCYGKLLVGRWTSNDHWPW